MVDNFRGVFHRNVENPAWVINLCRKSPAGERDQMPATDDIVSIKKNHLVFEPHVVLLNLYLKYGLFYRAFWVKM